MGNKRFLIFAEETLLGELLEEWIFGSGRDLRKQLYRSKCELESCTRMKYLSSVRLPHIVNVTAVHGKGFV